MFKKIITFFFFFLMTQTTEFDLFYNFVIWYTGQGSFSTFITPDSCLHFDMGGETFKLDPVKKICRNKLNQIFLTHLDWDHINLIQPFLKSNFKSCLFYPKKNKRPWLAHLNPCLSKPTFVKIISWGDDTKKDRNSSSIIYLIKNKVLITGDAPISEEKKWYFKLPKSLYLLVLGHHGSKTSTSNELLNWTQPKMAIASARKSKYGHPHKKVSQKLFSRKIPLISTEKLGNLYFQIH